MKWLKWLLILAAAGCALVLAVVGLAFISAVQRAIVLRVANNQPGLKLSVDRLAVGLGSVEVRNLHLEKDGLVVTAPQADVRLSLWEAAVHRRIIVESVTAKGWLVELPEAAAAPAPVQGGAPAKPVSGSAEVVAKPASSAAPAAPTPAFEGVFKFLKLPVEIQLTACDISGEVVLHQPAPQPAGHVTFALKGGHFFPSAKAMFDFSVRATGIAPPDSPVTSVETTGSLTVERNAAGEIDRLGVDATTEAKGPQLPSAKLRSTVALIRTATGENYDLALDLVDATGPQRLAAASVDFRPGAALTGSWSVHASRTQVAPFAFGAKLPRFAVAGEGTFSLDPTKLDPSQLDAQLTGKLTQQLGELGAVKPELAALGDLTSELNFDASFHAGNAALQRLDFTLSAAHPVLEAHLLQPVKIDRETNAITATNPAGELFRFKLHGLPLAWAKPFLSGVEIQGNDLNGEFSVMPQGDGFLLTAVSPVAVSHLTVSQGGRSLLKNADVSVTTSVDYSSKGTKAKVDAFSLKTPEGDSLQAGAEITIPAGLDPLISVTANFDANLPRLVNAFAPVGALRAHGGVQATLQGDVVSVAALAAELQNGAGSRLGAIEARQPFTFNTKTQRLQPQNTTADVLTVSLGRLPLAMAAPFLPPGLAVGGELSQGDFAVRADGEKLSLQTATPLRLTGLSVSQAGKPLLTRVDLQVAPSATYTPKETTADFGTLSVASGGLVLLTVKGNATLPADKKSPGHASLSFDSNLAALLMQPALIPYDGIAKGRMFGSADVTLGAHLEATAKLSLDTLTARDTGKLLPVMNFSLKAAQQASGGYSADAALLVDSSGRRSDLAIKALVNADADPLTFDARVTGTQIVVDDLQLFASAFSAPGGAPAPAAASPATPAPGPAPVVSPPPAPTGPVKPDAKPFWAGVIGQAGVQIKNVNYADRWQVQDVVAVLKVEPTRLALERAEAHFGEKSAFSASGEVKFAAKTPQPYDLAAKFALTDFDTAPLFRALDPSKPPTVEGVFNSNGSATGKGATVETLIDNTRGSVELTSKGGIFRGLAFAAKVSTGAKIVSGLSSLAGALGKLNSNDAANISSAADSISVLSNLLAELKYDQLAVHANRDENRDIHLTDFTLVSPGVHLQGTGILQYKPQVKLLDLPMHMELNLGARDDIEQTLNKGGQLTGDRDDLGYAKFRTPLVVDGTPAHPDTSKVREALLPGSGAAGSLLKGLGGLFGK